MELFSRNCSGDPFSCAVKAEEEEGDEALRVELEKGVLGNPKRGVRFEEGKRKGLFLVGAEVEGESEMNEDEEETIEIEANTIFLLLCSATHPHRHRKECLDNQKNRIFFFSLSHRKPNMLCSVIAVTTYTHR